ncbi:hypothetical protein GCM10009827_095010 [Dactylosporangium maewongense]|uniref:Uncharacterized protein n=1 Tax=Dactylosporangium maewongense TaxID=634393 RepID=A0ABP4NB02_9ACTN
MVPNTVSCLPEVYVHRWLVRPVQSHSCVCAPLAVEAPLTSRHRPDWAPTMGVLCPGTIGAARAGVRAATTVPASAAATARAPAATAGRLRPPGAMCESVMALLRIRY